MKTLKNSLYAILGSSLLVLASCSSITGGSKSESAKELAASGPTVVDVKTFPGTFDVNQSLQPVSQSQVIASVKDFKNTVTDVRLRFLHIPMEIPMKQLNTSTWVANIQPDQLRQLAVNGHTMKYEANVIAKDNIGQTAVSRTPIEIAVKAPEVTTS